MTTGAKIALEFAGKCSFLASADYNRTLDFLQNLVQCI